MYSIFVLALVCLTSSTTTCPQLGCDEFGSFSQKALLFFKNAPTKLLWTTSKSWHGLSEEMQGMGCVGSTDMVLACPYNTKEGNTRTLYLDPMTGTEMNTAPVNNQINNPGMPTILSDGAVLTVNSTNIGLIGVAPVNYSQIATFPQPMPYGPRSPVYLQSLGLHVVYGNFSPMFYVYNATKLGIDLVASFKVTYGSKDKNCPWLPVTDGAVSNNRLYLYAMSKDDVAFVAVDIMAETPHYRIAWVTPQPGKEQSREDNSCGQVPPSAIPGINHPMDVQYTMTATEEGQVIVTSILGLWIIQDYGNRGNYTYAKLSGSHFLSKMSGLTGQFSKHVWLTGWEDYEQYRPYITGFNYTKPGGPNDDDDWFIIDLPHMFNAFNNYEVNVTSRVMTFYDSTNNTQVLVFGISVNVDKKNEDFHRLCPTCSAGSGIKKVLVAVTPTKPVDGVGGRVIWAVPTPGTATSEVKGQIIGIENALIMYSGDSNGGRIYALTDHNE